ncbi:hypothetical protein Bca4012_009824 [Brassica carinata]
MEYKEGNNNTKRISSGHVDDEAEIRQGYLDGFSHLIFAAAFGGEERCEDREVKRAFYRSTEEKHSDHVVETQEATARDPCKGQEHIEPPKKVDAAWGFCFMAAGEDSARSTTTEVEGDM